MKKWALATIPAALAGLAAQDLLQRDHALRRNFPVLARLRYALESIGPELRQYIVTDNDQERPFTRDQRRWAYTSSKDENSLPGFGTDHDLETEEHSLPYGHEFAFSHNYPALLRSSGFELTWERNRPTQPGEENYPVRWFQLVAHS